MSVATTPLEQKLLFALRRIARDYRSAESLLKTGDAGLSGVESLEYAYDNLQWEAKSAIRGVRLPKNKPQPGPSKDKLPASPDAGGGPIHSTPK